MCTGAARAFAGGAGGASAACLLNVWLQTFACEFHRELASTEICFLLEEEASQGGLHSTASLLASKSDRRRACWHRRKMILGSSFFYITCFFES